MIVAVALFSLLLTPQPQERCADLSACRTMAEAAREAKDYEAFHDFAWAAYREGTSNDPELMLLVARAQSLSGRPGDALVMLERIAAVGASTDAATSEDFARVRALPRWAEVAEKLKAAGENAPLPAKEPTPAPPAEKPTPAAEKPAPPAKEPAAPAKKAAAPAKELAPPTKEPAPPPKKAAAPAKVPPAAAEPPAPTAKEPVAIAKEPAHAPNAPAPSAKAARSSAKPPLSFTTMMTPGALAYDGVSQRFIIADLQARRVAVVDENTGQVATMIGELGAPGAIAAIAIDTQQGDLWIASTNGNSSSLHKLQLISGRLLSTVPLAIEDPLTAMTYAPGQGLVAGDASGAIWRVRPDGATDTLGELEYVPLAFAADARGRLYVAGGTSRLARFSVGRTLRRIDTVEIDRSIPADAPFVASGNRLHFIVPVQGTFEIRSVPVK